MVRSRVFTNNRRQAVRLPNAVALPDEVRQVEILELGRSRLISPVGQSWDGLFEGGASHDFMAARPQPAPQLREPL